VRVFITGASGTLGSYICREMLGAGHDVTAYSRTSGTMERVNWVLGDAENCEDLARSARGHDVIIHLAAIPGPGRASPERLIATNLLTTTSVLESAVRSRISTVVFASSGAALGFTFHNRPIAPQYLPVDEHHPCELHDSYGLSKLLGEITCKSYTDAFGLKTICLRINNAWYVDRAGAESAVQFGWARGLTVEQLWERRYSKMVEDSSDHWPVPGPVSPRKNLWAVIDARDVAIAFRLAAESSIAGHQVFNLNGSDTCSLIPTPQLLARYFPEVPLRARLDNFDSLVSHRKAGQMLGFHPVHSWRRSDFAKWIAKRSAVNSNRDLDR
jgi:nucleoside-diphosphate-sugar epimerase